VLALFVEAWRWRFGGEFMLRVASMLGARMAERESLDESIPERTRGLLIVGWEKDMVVALKLCT
jgi:hypothetical protein